MPNRKQDQGMEVNPAEEPTRHDIGEIREILFGDDLRDHEQRFAQVERQLSEMTVELKAEIAKRFEALEKRIGEEVKNLSAGLAQLNAQGSAGRDELMQQFTEDARKLRSKIDSRFQKLLDIEHSDATRLADEKAGRVDLAELLSEVARRLREGTETAPEEE